MKAFSFPELQKDWILAASDLQSYFPTNLTLQANPLFNVDRVYPGQIMPVLLESEQGIHSFNFKWGLMLPWYTIGITSTNMFTVSVDEVMKRQVMHSLLTSHRCLIIASFDQEWRMENKRKTSSLSRIAEPSFVLLAGLYHIYTEPTKKEKMQSFTILIRQRQDQAAEDDGLKYPVPVQLSKAPLWLAADSQEEDVVRVLQSSVRNTMPVRDPE